MTSNVVQPGLYYIWINHSSKTFVADQRIPLGVNSKEMQATSRGYWEGSCLDDLEFISSAKDLAKVYAQMDADNKKYIPGALSYDRIDHDFSMDADQSCTRCGVPVYHVQNGRASWICNQTYTRSCCGQTGHDKWNANTSQWECSSCGAVTSNDPNYPNDLFSWQKQQPWSVPKQVHPPVVKETKCTCGAHAILSNYHSPWCDWKEQ